MEEKKKTPILGWVCTVLFASIFWGSLALLDPFGFKTAADLHSESIFMRLVGGPWYQSKAQDQITIVLIDDNYIEKIADNEHWPMSYVQQDLLLNDILDLQPKAVFLDLLYRHKHSEGLTQFIETINQKETVSTDKPTIPIVIPYLVKDKQGVSTCDPNSGEAQSFIIDNSVIKEFQQSRAIPSYIGWTGCGDRYPAFILGDERHLTPAFVLYKTLCDQSPGYSPGCEQIHHKNFDGFKPPMVIRWGTSISREHQSALQKADIECLRLGREGEMTRWEYLTYQLSQMFTLDQSLSSNTGRGIVERCTYTDTVHATWFLGASPELREYLRSMIQNRIVLMGTKIEGVHDYVLSPVNGRLPGVYMFGMALDNYIEYGSQYFREMSDLSAGLFEIMVLFLVSLSSGLLWNYWPAKGSNSSGGGNRYVFTINAGKSIFLFVIFKIAIPVLLTVGFALFLWSQHYAPMDWIGISLLAFFASPVKTVYCLRRTPITDLDEDWLWKPCKCILKLKCWILKKN